MPRKMKGLLIDPFSKSIVEVVHEDGIDDIYEKIGRDCFDTVRVGPRGDVGYLDDEGLLRGDSQKYFKLSGYPQPLGGKCLVLGLEDDGASRSPRVTLSELKANVSWVRPDVRFSHQVERTTEVDDPLFGRMTHVSRIAVFVDGYGNEFTDEDL